MVSLHYNILKEDYVNFYTYVMWDAGDIRRKRIKSIAKQAGFVLLFVAVYYFAGGFRFLSKITVIIILLMFGTSFIPVLGGRSGTDRQGEEIAEDPENVSVFADTQLNVTDGGLQVKTEFADTKYTWKAIIRKTETPAYYFLFVNAIQAIIIPKRIFDNKEEQAEFDKMLSRNISLEAEIKDDITHAGE